MSMRKHYTPEFKSKLVLALLKEEQSASQIAAAHGVHPTMLYRWRDAALAGLPSLFSDQAAQQHAALQTAHELQTQQLYAEIGRLTTELTWLKKKLLI
jgi:transposase-like protein